MNLFFLQNSSKSRKVKVLKDEPLVTSSKVKEKPQPGTLAFLAQRDNSKPGLRQNGPLCGQCEIKTAAVVSYYFHQNVYLKFLFFKFSIV